MFYTKPRLKPISNLNQTIIKLKFKPKDIQIYAESPKRGSQLKQSLYEYMNENMTDWTETTTQTELKLYSNCDQTHVKLKSR